MNIKIVDILQKFQNGCQVIVQVLNNRFIVEWIGEIPQLINYNVELEIEEELVWQKSVKLSNRRSDVMIQTNNHIKIIARLEYDRKNDLATLNIYDTIILIDLVGCNQDISETWVEVKCRGVRIYDNNL